MFSDGVPVSMKIIAWMWFPLPGFQYPGLRDWNADAQSLGYGGKAGCGFGGGVEPFGYDVVGAFAVLDNVGGVSFAFEAVPERAGVEKLLVFAHDNPVRFQVGRGAVNNVDAVGDHSHRVSRNHGGVGCTFSFDAGICGTVNAFFFALPLNGGVVCSAVVGFA